MFLSIPFVVVLKAGINEIDGMVDNTILLHAFFLSFFLSFFLFKQGRHRRDIENVCLMFAVCMFCFMFEYGLILLI